MGRHKQTSKPLYQPIWSMLSVLLHSPQWRRLATKHAFYSFIKFPLSWFPSPPSPGDSTVPVGEGVPGACLLPPPHGPGGAFSVAGPDDALSLGQHDRPREADPVSPSVRHWPQVGIGTRSSANALLLASYADIYQRINGCWVDETECLCLSCNLPPWCFIVILSVRHYFCSTAPQMHQSPSVMLRYSIILVLYCGFRTRAKQG